MAITMTIIDDGSLDTILKCDDCGGIDRWTYDGWDPTQDGSPEEQYEAFVEYAGMSHECPVDINQVDSCNICGGTQLEERLWRDYHTRELLDYDREVWCADCEEFVTPAFPPPVYAALVQALDNDEPIGSPKKWTMEQVLDEINRDRNEEWIPYTWEDWRGGWNHWVEGHTYKLLEVYDGNERNPDEGRS